MHTSPRWQERALCANTPGIDPDLFFPEGHKVPEEARQMCLRCPVRVPCSQDGYTEKIGVRAGMNLKGADRPEKRTRTCHCGVATSRKSSICAGCAPNHKDATALTHA